MRLRTAVISVFFCLPSNSHAQVGAIEAEPVAAAPLYAAHVRVGMGDVMNIQTAELLRAITPKLSVGLLVGRYKFFDYSEREFCYDCRRWPLDDKHQVESTFVGIPVKFVPLGNMRSGPTVFGTALFGNFTSRTTIYYWNDPQEGADRRSRENLTLKCERSYARRGKQGTLMGGGGWQWVSASKFYFEGNLFQAKVFALSSQRYDEKSNCIEGKNHFGNNLGNAFGISANAGYAF